MSTVARPQQPSGSGSAELRSFRVEVSGTAIVVAGFFAWGRRDRELMLVRRRIHAV